MIRKRLAPLDDKMIFRLVVDEIAPFSSTLSSSPPITFSMIRKRLNHNVTIVAAKGSRPSFGFVSLRLKSRTLFVDMLAVHASMKGRGWGKRLMQAAENFGHSNGCTSIQLFVDNSNSGAIGFYESMGYRKTHYIDELETYRMDKRLARSRF